jgi:hypothetical protein
MSDTSATEVAPRLPRYIRFRDLRNAGIVDNWEQLSRLVDYYGFPSGTLLSPNMRVWAIEDVQRWLANRPSERKVIARRRSKEAEFVT